MAAPGASDTVVVVTGGDPIPPSALDGLPAPLTVVAADSGVDHALALGLEVALAVGDFDSATPAAVALVTERGGVVERHPAAKDHTDLELALLAARRFAPRRIHVLGGHGGRLDHLLANALVLAGPALAEVDVTAQMGPARLAVVRRRTELSGVAGELVSLLAVHGPARSVTTEGLSYPLLAEDLRPGSTRGISNTFLGERASVELEHGVLLVVQPRSPHPPPEVLLCP
jgi:thiamine pyrophosphokinase